VVNCYGIRGGKLGGLQRDVALQTHTTQYQSNLILLQIGGSKFRTVHKLCNLDKVCILYGYLTGYITTQDFIASDRSIININLFIFIIFGILTPFHVTGFTLFIIYVTHIYQVT
jgi:hypothetical protein